MPPAACEIGEVLPSCLRRVCRNLLCLRRPVDAAYVPSDRECQELESDNAACPSHPPVRYAHSLGIPVGMEDTGGKVEKHVVN